MLRISPLKQKVIHYIDTMAEELRDISLFLHAHPELGEQEHQAASLLINAAKARGFQVRQPVSGFETAFIAHKGQGPKIGFLAEYDALPQLGHACGHNLIAAMSWGAAAAFAAVAGNRATASFIGCPAEETVGAKVAMAEDGVFNDLTAALIVHPAAENAIGGTSYASHPLQITFYGRPAHVASKTDKGINALDALILFYQEMKLLRQTLREDVIWGGIITKGGIAPNVIPAEAQIRYTIRSLSSDYLEASVLPAVKQLARQIADATGTTVETLHYEPLFKELRNDKTVMNRYQQNMLLLGETVTLLPDEEADGSTDVGNVSHATPTIHPDLFIGQLLSAHTPEFVLAAGSDFAQQRLLVGAKAMSMTAIDIIEEENHKVF